MSRRSPRRGVPRPRRPRALLGILLPAMVASALAGGCAYESAGTTTSTVLDPALVPPATGPAALVFTDQLVDGSAVVIQSVTLPAHGFVVLHADAAGVPGEVVGVSELIGPGTVADVAVALFLPLAAETVLHAGLHIDVDQDGEFLYEPPDALVDVPAVSESGTAVAASARVGLLAPLGPAALTFESQRTNGEAVVVAEVTLPAPGFVALQAGQDGLPGALLGLSGLLPAGTSQDVSIPLDRPEAGLQTIFAVAYIDRDGDGVAGITTAGSPDEVAQAFAGGPARASAEVTVVLIVPAELEVEDQEGDGTVVTVFSVRLPSPGFLEVRLDANGSPGQRLGVSDPLPAGLSTDVEIELAQDLTADAVLWVRVRIDLDGDEDLGEGDPIALDEQGRRVLASLAYTFVEED